ncbi:MAG: hypothetical protein ACK4PR_06095 [Gammaproteobacteria bacterium]
MHDVWQDHRVFYVNVIVATTFPALRADLRGAYSISHLSVTLSFNLQCLFSRFNAGYDCLKNIFSIRQLSF